MIKINLLPKTLNEKAALRNTAILFGAILLALLAAGIGYSLKLQADVERQQALAAETEAYEQRVKAIQDQTAQLLASVGPIQEKLKFINEVLKYNLKYPKLYEDVAKWTYEKTVLDAIQSDGQTVTLQGRVKSLDDLGRYLLNMYAATDLFAEVRITQATGFGSSSEGNVQAPSTVGAQLSGSQATQAGIEAITGSVARQPVRNPWITFVAVCKLRDPIVAPVPPGGEGAPQAGGGVPGAPGPEPMGMPSDSGVPRTAEGDLNPSGGNL